LYERANDDITFPPIADMLQQILSQTRRLKTAALVALPGLLTACDRAVFNPAGDIARQQRDIIVVSTGVMLLIIVPVLILIVLFAWRYRRGGRGTYDPDFDHSAGLELAIWSAPLLIIIALGALTWSSTHLLDPFRPLPAREGTKPLVVQVVSLDWKWLFIYPEQGIATVNELALPVDRPVRFDITSSNMMNTFYAPTLAGMIYAMPGMRSQLNAVLRRPGDFQGFSANYSGAGFSDMRFALKGVDDAGFARWIGEARNSGNELALASYRKLLVPSQRVPVMRFASVDSDLYRRILERCVEPGTPCTSEQMRHGGGNGGLASADHAHESRGGSRP
jgi:cytochrome o ubiquinol oxidase subunit 2